MSTLPGESFGTKPRRNGIAWRWFRFFRSDKRRKQRPSSVSQAPPRIGAIGNDVLSFDLGGDDFSTLKLDSTFTNFNMSKSAIVTDSAHLPRSQPTEDRRQSFRTKLEPPRSPSLDTLLSPWLSQAISIGDAPIEEPQNSPQQTNTSSQPRPSLQTQSTSTSLKPQDSPLNRSQSFNTTQSRPRYGGEPFAYSKTRPGASPEDTSPVNNNNNIYARSAASVSSKRLSIGSQYYAQTVRTHDSDNQSINSAGSNPASKRFEIKTNSLLTTKTDNTPVAISQTIARINGNSYSSAAPMSVTSRGFELPKRAVTDGVKTLQKLSERSPSRKSSAPAIRNSWAENASTPGSSRTSTPSRLGDRLKDLEESSIASGLQKGPGRPQVLGKMHGGVAAKLAVFEQIHTVPGAPQSECTANNNIATGTSVFPPRSNSDSRVSSSELQLNKPTRKASNQQLPGKVDDVVGQNFRKTLEGITGALATKLQEQQEKEQTGAGFSKSFVSLHEKRAKVPKDVLAMIDLSGVDQEVVIDDYLKVGSPGLGYTKTWDDQEVRRASSSEFKKLLGEIEQTGEKKAAAAAAAAAGDGGDKVDQSSKVVEQPSVKTVEEQQQPVDKAEEKSTAAVVEEASTEPVATESTSRANPATHLAASEEHATLPPAEPLSLQMPLTLKQQFNPTSLPVF